MSASIIPNNQLVIPNSSTHHINCERRINIKQIILILSYIFSMFLVSGCKHKSPATSINPEFIGVWSSDNGCKMELAKNGNSLLLIKYTDSSHNTFTNIPLVLKKDGIGTKFSATNNNKHFRGLYLEGEMLIDNYCNQPLHKTNN